MMFSGAAGTAFAAGTESCARFVCHNYGANGECMNYTCYHGTDGYGSGYGYGGYGNGYRLPQMRSDPWRNSLCSPRDSFNGSAYRSDYYDYDYNPWYCRDASYSSGRGYDDWWYYYDNDYYYDVYDWDYRNHGNAYYSGYSPASSCTYGAACGYGNGNYGSGYPSYGYGGYGESCSDRCYDWCDVRYRGGRDDDRFDRCYDSCFEDCDRSWWRIEGRGRGYY